MPLENRNLEVGTRLVANYKKQTYVCTVEKAEEGDGLVFKLDDGRTFKSPSSAGAAVMGGKAVNGWRFWSLEGEAPAATDKPAKTAKPRKTKSKGAKLISRIPNKAGIDEGQSSWFCSACMKSFVIDGDAEPEVCPEGHRADDPELTAPAE